MNQTRQLGQGAGQIGRFLLEGTHQTAPANLFAHPALKERLGGFPEIKLRVKLAAKALDIEQGFLQHDQLWLDFDIEAARGLKQAQQNFAEGNILERPVENRFADGADGGLEFIDPGFLGRPAGFNMGFGHPCVVAAEEGKEVLGKIILVAVGQRADDAEIERDITAVRSDKNVAGVHVGVEKTIAEYLGKKDFNAGGREFGEVDAIGAQLVDLRNRRALHALHDHDGRGAPVPVNFRDDQQLRLAKVAPQLRGIRCFTHQV